MLLTVLHLMRPPGMAGNPPLELKPNDHYPFMFRPFGTLGSFQGARLQQRHRAKLEAAGVEIPAGSVSSQQHTP